MIRRIFLLLVVSICLAPILGVSPSKIPKVLIVQDELPQMEVLAKFLRERGRLSVTISDQQSLPDDFSPLEIEMKLRYCET